MDSTFENRDWTPYTWRKVRPDIRRERCNLCGVCRNDCPFKAAYIEAGEVRIRQDRCLGCGICALRCRRRAIFMRLPKQEYEIGEANG